MRPRRPSPLAQELFVEMAAIRDAGQAVLGREPPENRVGVFELSGPLRHEPDELAFSPRERTHPVSVRPDADEGDPEGAQTVEPKRLIEVRLEGDLERGSLFVPESVVVARDDPKLVVAGRRVRVERRPPRSGVHPRRIKPLESVSEAHFL